jgi:hypothetical protein
MIKFTEIICRIGLFATISLATGVEANQVSILGSYKSNGYTLDLEANGEYHSCNPRNRCLRIPQTRSSRQGQARIWKHAGYTYRVTPVGLSLLQGHYARISVQIIDSKLKIISNRIFRYQ